MPRAKVKREVVVKDALDAFNRADFNNGIFAVGVLDDKVSYDDGTRVVDVATWNEFGTANIPARPALRSAILSVAPQLQKLGRKQAKLMLFRKLRMDKAVRDQAKIMQKEMRDSIESWDRPPNAPSTVAQKGFDDPLIDTGLYKDSIEFKAIVTRKDQL